MSTRTQILGVPVDPATTGELMAQVHSALEGDRPYVIGYQNLHGVYLYHKDPTLAEFRDKADLVYIDGMPIILAAKLGGKKLGRDHRTTSIDWIIPLLRDLTERGAGVFFLGGKASVVETALARFRSEIPGLPVSYHDGYFDQKPGSADNERVLQAIKDSGAQVLFLGMGMPIQERWFLNHADRLDVKVVWAVGAVMDYFGGAVKTPPRWMGRVGLEWLFRLCSEPKRLYYRYLVEPWSLFPYLMRDVFRRSK